MNILKLKRMLQKILSRRPEILFGYLHGSVYSSRNPNDIDVAVFLDLRSFERLQKNGNVNLGFAIPLEMELEKKIAMPIDLQILNNAPLRFKYRAISKGEVVIDCDSGTRTDFECLTRVEYFDFRPKREAYLKEAFSS